MSLLLWSFRAAARHVLHTACPLAMPPSPAIGTLCVDATRAGNLAHMLNHSCAPNCYSRTLRCGALTELVALPAACAVACRGPAVPCVKLLAQCTFALMRSPSKPTIPSSPTLSTAFLSCRFVEDGRAVDRVIIYAGLDIEVGPCQAAKECKACCCTASLRLVVPSSDVCFACDAHRRIH